MSDTDFDRRADAWMDRYAAAGAGLAGALLAGLGALAVVLGVLVGVIDSDPSVFFAGAAMMVAAVPCFAIRTVVRYCMARMPGGAA